ncbi:MAG: helix-turn-helix transcriptional regulator [Clostridiaceae bacterium]|nr:helix-turn-helix transcriptional regulator [Clostridiaceae bacterium]
MDAQVIGSNIAKWRKEQGITQDQLAEKLSVSAQAVSKWENGVSLPDITLLPQLATIFEVTLDQLFSREVEPETQYIKPENRKDPDKMLLKIVVDSSDGDKVRVNVPLALMKLLEGTDGAGGFNINGINLGALEWEKVIKLIDEGVLGKLVEVESADGDHVEIFVE